MYHHYDLYLYDLYLRYRRIHLNADKISLRIPECKMEKFNKTTIYYSSLIKEN